MTFASMGVLTVCMLLIGAAYLLGVNIDAMVEYIGDQNETVVYMDQGASDDQIAAADTAIRSTEHVVGVTYMSPQDVLAVYSDMLSSYTNLQDAFANDNPFYPNYRVVVDSPDNIEAVSQQLRQIDGVYQVNAPLEMSKVFVSLQRSFPTPATASCWCWPLSASWSSTTPSRSPSLTAARRSTS